MKQWILAAVAASPLIVSMNGVATAADDAPAYGRDLMSAQERAEHREHMRNLGTEQERNEYRQQTHEQMKKRAEERGVTIQENPGNRGKGYGRGDPAGYGGGGGGGRGYGR